MKVCGIEVREIFDSRGEPTIEVGVRGDDDITSYAQIPSGKSRGSNEAVVFDHARAEAVVRDLIVPRIVGRTFNSVQELDKALLDIDSTTTKRILGGNVMLGVSVAHARNCASADRKQLWELLRDEFFGGKNTPAPPLIFSNFVNGGAHARNNLSFQEYLVIAKTSSSVIDTIERLEQLYRQLGEVLGRARRLGSIPLGDEGGYSLDFKNALEPLQTLSDLVVEMRLENVFSLGIDAAATNFYRDRLYNLDGSMLGTQELVETYARYAESVPLLTSIEDPFHEGDARGFKSLVEKFGSRVRIVGDDLTTTNPRAIRAYAEGGCVSGVIIKPNQIGTLSEACEAMRVAHEYGVQCIVSHRSGETDDPLIIHLAKAGSAEGVKIGAPVKERVTKFNELIRLYSE